MADSIHDPSDEGIYIIDRRTTSIDESVNALANSMFDFVNKTRRQRINQRNRVERLSPLLDWKNLGLEYEKARILALRRAYPDAFIGADEDNVEEMDWGFGSEFPLSVHASPMLRMSGLATPGDMGTLTEEVGILMVG